MTICQSIYAKIINAVISILRNHDKPVETTLLNVFNRIPPDEVFIFLSDNYDKIIVSLFYLINTGESDKADKVLDKIICHHEDVLTCFLKGEACYFAGNAEKAFKYFERSIKFDSSFWPSLYRMVMISKKTDFYKWGHYLAKAVRVMEKRAKQGFELFLGGFSIEYYIGVLQKMQF